MGPTETKYSVVVAGHMNPAIHHPAWYHLVGIFDGMEIFPAMERVGVVHANVAEFWAGPFHVRCLNGQWVAETTGDHGFHPVIELAQRTFKRLDDTPVTAFGLNLTVTQVLAKATPRSLAERLRGSLFFVEGLATPPTLDEITTSYDMPQLTTSDAKATRRFRLSFRTHAAPPVGEVYINVHHDVEAAGSGHYDLAALLELSADVFQFSMRVANDVLSAVDR